jgi:hypothetical protein
MAKGKVRAKVRSNIETSRAGGRPHPRAAAAVKKAAEARKR